MDRVTWQAASRSLALLAAIVSGLAIASAGGSTWKQAAVFAGLCCLILVARNIARMSGNRAIQIAMVAVAIVALGVTEAEGYVSSIHIYLVCAYVFLLGLSSQTDATERSTGKVQPSGQADDTGA